MKRIGILASMAWAGLLAACGQPVADQPTPAEEVAVADDPKPPGASVDVPPALAEIIKERNKLYKRQTGAMLTIQAKSEKVMGVRARRGGSLVDRLQRSSPPVHDPLAHAEFAGIPPDGAPLLAPRRRR
jgi:hypothetical protein